MLVRLSRICVQVGRVGGEGVVSDGDLGVSGAISSALERPA